MASILALPGSCVYSDFRLTALQNALGAKAVRAVWVHYVLLTGPTSETLEEELAQLLTYGSFPPKNDKVYQELYSTFDSVGPGPSPNTNVFYVTPRVGTISPWSSKATSIAQVCGLGSRVKRIERGMLVAINKDQPIDDATDSHMHLFFDRMTQTATRDPPDLEAMFAEHEPAPATVINLHANSTTPKEALQKANRRLGLALDASEIDYLINAYALDGPLARDPFDVELFMFAQVNSEHCRHKQFNADWTIDGMRKANTLFSMIKATHKKNPKHTVSAYSDNAAVLSGEMSNFWAPNHLTGEWVSTKEQVHYLAKVETHNHPTAVSPFPGAATGSGGEIRDEGAVGRGSKPKAGLAGFNVSDLLIPDHVQPWEQDVGRPKHIASSLDIMLEAPIGSAAFNNEFGRPCTVGYFRTLLTKVPVNSKDEEIRGYHKPIMIAGGVGTVRPQNALKDPEIVKPGAYVIVLGGPAMLIGLGGGAASSITSGEGSAELDFASVQRGNPEMQRRAQMVIDACTALGNQNPIKLIHDVGAGGLSNALPELVHDANMGAHFELRNIENADLGMSPLQIWCCEAQERYVMIVGEEDIKTFEAIAKRERCGYSVVGRAVSGKSQEGAKLVLTDRDSSQFPRPIDLPMSTLFGKPPKMSRIVESRKLPLPAFDSSLRTYLSHTPTEGLLDEAVDRVLKLPAVGSKSFLITIGDRTVGGLVTRDQMVGPWQTPVSDVSVTATSLMLGVKTGEAMAMGERPTLALISPAASARMAVAESLTNLGAADVAGGLERIRLSANWMAASNHPGEGAALYEAVEAIGLDLCPKLGISIPVGKDSMSMKMSWKPDGEPDEPPREVIAPLSVVISAFAPVANIRRTWTPTLRRYEDVGETILLYVDLAEGSRALGGSALAQVFGKVGNDCPDVRDANLIKDYYDALSQLHEAGIVLAYHDQSDGGLFTSMVEMMFAGRCGLDVMLDHLIPSASSTKELIQLLFNEELGALFQVRKRHETDFHRCFATCGPPPGLIRRIGSVPARLKKADHVDHLTLRYGLKTLFRQSRADLQQRWAHTSHVLQSIRDNPACADAEYTSLRDEADAGLSYNLTFKPSESILPWLSTTLSAALPSRRPRVAILREQGVNGHAEMAFAFSCAGFAAVDVHMTDLLTGRVSLASFTGLAACGGFSYGDVLGAGQGWAKSVLMHKTAREMFRAFFARKDSFALGVCNGCQFLTKLKELIPGTAGWPEGWKRNESEQYEARLVMVEVVDPGSSSSSASSSSAAAASASAPAATALPPSVFLHGMHNSTLPIAVAHGEGRAVFSPSSSSSSSPPSPPAATTALTYIDPTTRRPTTTYPHNPNGSPHGLAGVRSQDGRVLVMMPHPERMVLRDAVSWAPESLAGEEEGRATGPWVRLFESARRWVG